MSKAAFGAICFGLLSPISSALMVQPAERPKLSTNFTANPMIDAVFSDPCKTMLNQIVTMVPKKSKIAIDALRNQSEENGFSSFCMDTKKLMQHHKRITDAVE